MLEEIKDIDEIIGLMIAIAFLFIFIFIFLIALTGFHNEKKGE